MMAFIGYVISFALIVSYFNMHGSRPELIIAAALFFIGSRINGIRAVSIKGLYAKEFNDEEE